MYNVQCSTVVLCATHSALIEPSHTPLLGCQCHMNKTSQALKLCNTQYLYQNTVLLSIVRLQYYDYENNMR